MINLTFTVKDNLRLTDSKEVGFIFKSSREDYSSDNMIWLREVSVRLLIYRAVTVIIIS